MKPISSDTHQSACLRTAAMKKANRQTAYVLAAVAVACVGASAFPGFLTTMSAESQLGMSWDPLAPVVGETSLGNGSSIEMAFDCNAPDVDRWILQLTATADASNLGSVTFALEGAKPKTVRTGLFRKMSGTYTLPLEASEDAPPGGARRLRISFAGDSADRPLMYVARMRDHNSTRFQIALTPEVKHPMPMPKYAVYPRQISEFVASGRCDASPEIRPQ